MAIRRDQTISFSAGFVSSMKNPPKNMLSNLVNFFRSEGLLTDTLSLGNVKFMGKFSSSGFQNDESNKKI